MTTLYVVVGSRRTHLIRTASLHAHTARSWCLRDMPAESEFIVYTDDMQNICEPCAQAYYDAVAAKASLAIARNALAAAPANRNYSRRPRPAGVTA